MGKRWRMVVAVIIFLIVWIGFGVFGGAADFAYFQHKYPELAEQGYNEDVYHALWSVLFGPIGLIVTYEMSDYSFKYGLKWK
jgi:hypothetical protein